MANTRIRYKEVAPNVLRSRRHFMTSEGREVYVELDFSAMKFQVFDSATGFVVAEGGKSTNRAVLKIQLKDALMGLGANFEDEKRNRGQATA
jgi:hypothetical protein